MRVTDPHNPLLNKKPSLPALNEPLHAAAQHPKKAKLSAKKPKASDEQAIDELSAEALAAQALTEGWPEQATEGQHAETEDVLLAQANTGAVSDGGGAASGQGSVTPAVTAPAATGLSGTTLLLGGVGLLGVAAAAGGGSDRQASTPATTPTDVTPPVFSAGAASSVNFAENGTGTVHTAAATDNVAVTAYAFADGGADNDKFNLDTGTGALTFKTAPDFEAPASAAGSNAYTVKVKALDAAGNSTVQTITVNVTDVQDVEIQGSITAGPITSTTLKVQAWGYINNSWEKLGGPANVDANGTYQLKIRDSYTGPVKLLVVDASDAEADYMDEATGQPKDIAALSLMTYVDAGTNRLANVANITPLTTLASQLAQDNLSTATASNLQQQLITNSQSAVAQIFGLSANLNTLTPQAVIDKAGNAVGGNAYGAALAVVSGIEKAQGGADTLSVLNTLKAHISADLLASTPVFALNPEAKAMIQNGYDQTQTLLQNGGNTAAADQLVQNLNSKTLMDANAIFAQVASKGGNYQTMFDLAKASYARPIALENYPGMAPNNDVSSAPSGVSFSISATDLGLKGPVAKTNIPNEGTVFANGYFVAFDKNYIDRSSVALVGRGQDALFLTFRGTAGLGDAWDDAVDMHGHYERFAPLFAGIDKYLKEHTEIATVYVGGHSLGGQMANMYMQRHWKGGSSAVKNNNGIEVQYQAITFEAANKGIEGSHILLDPSRMDDSRAVGFEMRGDPVPDLSLIKDRVDTGSNNYGHVVHLEYESRASFLPHGMGVVGTQLSRVIAALDKLSVPKNSRYYVDDNNDGVIVTTGQATVIEGLNNAGLFAGTLTADLILQSKNPTVQAVSAMIEAIAKQNHIDSVLPFTAAVNQIYQENLGEYKATGLYNFETVWSETDTTQKRTLVVTPFGLSDDETYVVPQNGIDAVVAASTLWSDKNFKIDARYTKTGIYLMGNDANNVLVGGTGGDVLVGNGDKDILLGGVGNDVLFGGDFKDNNYIFNSLTEGLLTADHSTTIKGHLGQDIADDVSFMRGGEGRDNIICSRDDLGVLGDNDYCFIDVDLTKGVVSDVDTIWQFNPAAGLAFSSDYLIFSALQFGFTEDELDAIGSQSRKLMGQKVWNINAANFETDNSYQAPVGEPMFFLDNNWLYYDADGASQDTGNLGEVLVKFEHIQGAMNDISGSNLLFVWDFEALDWSKPDLPNQAPVFTLGEYASIDLTEDAGTGRTLSTLATDPEGDAITAYGVQTNGRLVNVTVDAQTGEWRWSPTAAAQSLSQGQIAKESITLKATDANGSIGTGTITFTLTGLNDAPLLAIPQAITYTDTTAADSFTAVAGRLGGLDVDDNTTLTYGVEGATTVTGGYTQDSITYDLSRTGSYGTLYLNSSSGAYLYLPDNAAINAASAAATDTFTLTTSDGSLSASQTLQVNIAGVPEGGTGTYTPGQAVISLGEHGNLIAPVFVDGNWYYAWDMNGDGVHSAAVNINAKFDRNGSVINAAGTGWQLDLINHDVLDNIFKFASDFTTQDTDADTDNTHRFAQINGVKLALPTIGDGSNYFSSGGLRSGTAVDNSPAGEANATYDDLLAIWDAHNGNGTSTLTNGTPAGWLESVYWSATPSSFGHASFRTDYGIVHDSNALQHWAAVQVLPATADTTAPTLDITDNTSGTATGDVLFTFTFSEAVTNFSANDVVLSAGTKGTFTTVNASTYTLSVTPPQGSGSFTVDVDHLNGIVADTSGNALGNVAAVTQAYDIPTYTPGQSTISLGEYGNLIAPVFVDGNWYYAWDMNGDGVHSGDANSDGKFDYDGSVSNAAGMGWAYDFLTHNVLDNIFKFASDFTKIDMDNNTDNTYRFAKINGVKVALPTIGDGSGYVSGSGNRTGTAVDNVPAGEANAAYDDLLAIWDAHNGTGTGTGTNGTPVDWQEGIYGSATPTLYGHATLSSVLGTFYDYKESSGRLAAIQVL